MYLLGSSLVISVPYELCNRNSENCIHVSRAYSQTLQRDGSSKIFVFPHILYIYIYIYIYIYTHIYIYTYIYIHIYIYGCVCVCVCVCVCARVCVCVWDKWWCSWLRHCATNRKVAGLIPDGVLEFFIYIIRPATLWPWGGLSL